MAIQASAAFDIGNGFVKYEMIFPEEGLSRSGSFPAGAAPAPASMVPDRMEDFDFSHAPDRIAAAVVSDAAGAYSGRAMVFGARAGASDDGGIVFGVSGAKKKAEDPLSAILFLAAAAAEALAYSCLEEEVFPKQLDVNLRAALALPIEQYTDGHEDYKARLEGRHDVFVQNFEAPVHIALNVTEVSVYPEGVCAVEAVKKSPAAVLDTLLAQALSQGASYPDGYTGEVIASAGNIIGVDIGEGTVNFPVLENGAFSSDLSSSIRTGWGSVLERYITDRRAAGSFQSRRQLSQFLLNASPMPVQRQRAARIRAELESWRADFAQDIVQEFSRIWAKTGASIEAVFVFGGAADTMADILIPLLEDASRDEFGFCVPVLMLPANLSRRLNCTGLAAHLREGA